MPHKSILHFSSLPNPKHWNSCERLLKSTLDRNYKKRESSAWIYMQEKLTFTFQRSHLHLAGVIATFGRVLQMGIYMPSTMAIFLSQASPILSVTPYWMPPEFICQAAKTFRWPHHQTYKASWKLWGCVNTLKTDCCPWQYPMYCICTWLWNESRQHY